MLQQIKFQLLVRILPGTISRDLVTKQAWNGREHFKNVNFVLIIAVLEILDSIKYFPNVSAPHSRCMINIKNLRFNEYHFCFLSNLLLEI